MATPVRLPPIATDTTDGTLVRWLVAVGERVEAGQVVAEVDTAKVLFEVEAPCAGTLVGLAALPGEDVLVGDTLAWIGEPGEAPPVREPRAGAPAPAPPPATPAPAEERICAAPPVRRLAERFGVDLAAVRGTGPEGRILSDDVRRAAGIEGEPGAPE